MTPSKHELRILKKLDLLCAERAKKPLDIRAIWHQGVDLTSSAVTELERRKHKRGN